MKALLWDVDGTLAETERRGHLVAFNQAFEALGLPWRWDDALYGSLLAVTGGRERLLHDMRARSDAPPTAPQREALAIELYARKNVFYAGIVASGCIALRAGAAELIDESRAQGVRQAITTTTSRANLDILLRTCLGAGWERGFDAIVCGEDVRRKKPDPEVFVAALRQLGLQPRQALAIEDSPGGVSAARAVDLPVLVTRSEYFAQATFDGVVAIGDGLHTRRNWHPALPDADDGRVRLADLQRWCSSTQSVSQHA